MTTIYRPHSPSREDHGRVNTDRDHVAGEVGVLNQAARAFSSTADWQIQEGTVTWEGDS